MRFLPFLVVLTLIACNSSKDNNAQINTQSQEDFVMYKPSEMTLHMNYMYAYNKTIRNQILSGEIQSGFPEAFLKIYTAKLSEFKHRNQRFENFSNEFITNQKAIYAQPDSLSLVKQYNKTINSCITCHQTECTGPIPKIKKLLIH